MNEQVFKPVENFVNDFKNHFINTFTSGELSKYMDKENIQILDTNPFEMFECILYKLYYTSKIELYMNMEYFSNITEKRK